ncbi:FG-GAP-like repeat-containing protein [Paenibacillus sp. GCM10023250]|uniref:FG-GAP-like repeat-containing protein n=1 Tax=Paenibacillus sp. GCM10023250 TaxID=3252648 RepID=UPI0036060BCD
MRFRRHFIRKALLLGGLASLLLAAGCQYTTTPADLLIAPKPVPENAALTDALHTILPLQAKLSVVTHEDANSAILQLDGDGDGRKEAFVVFADESGTQRVMVLEQTSGGWRERFTFAETSTYGVDVLRAADLDGDGVPEVMIGWNQFGEPQHILTLYHIGRTAGQKGAPRPLAELPYDTMGIGDADGDGRPEIGLIQLQRLKLTAGIDIYRFADGEAAKLASAPLDGSVNAYLQVKLGQLAPGQYGVVGDAAIGTNSSTTTMLAWEDGALARIYPPKSPGDENVQTNANAVLSGDANGDGMLDIPQLTEAPGQADGVPYSDLLWIEVDKQWDGQGGFLTVARRYADAGNAYAIQIPDEWTGFTFRRPAGGGPSDIALDAYDEETGQRAEVLTVRAAALDAWDDREGELQADDVRYLKLGTADGLVYYAVWHDKLQEGGRLTTAGPGSFPPDEAEMKRLFKLLTP